MARVKRGSLVVVGTGIQLVNHMTHEALQCIEDSDRVLHVVPDYPTEMWLKTLNASAESLNSLYQSGKPRLETYEQMVETIMDQVRKGLKVCAVFYGHPGVFVIPGHEAIKRARREGFEARMLPGISAEDCLFADLGVNPGQCGCQSFEATDFLVHRRRFDSSSALILWQIAAIGSLDHQKDPCSDSGIKVLVEVLRRRYGANHEVFVYEASPFPYPVAKPSIQMVRLVELPKARIALASTLYVPPKESIPDEDMLKRLNLYPLSSK